VNSAYDGGDRPSLTVHLDNIADRNGSVKEQDQTADEVVDQVLGPKAIPIASAPPRKAKTASGIFTDTSAKTSTR